LNPSRDGTTDGEERQPGLPPPFSLEEYGERLVKVRAAMDAAGIEVLVVTDPSNMSWCTGYDAWSFYTHQAVLITAAGPPRWWGRNLDVEGAHRTTWLPADHVVGYPEDHVQSPDRHPHQHLAALLTELGSAGGSIGVELDNYYYSAAAHAHLTVGLPAATFVDATGLVNRQRAVKSETEIGYLRRAARIVERMHARILETIEPGLGKNLLVAEILHASAAGVPGPDGFGGDYAAIVPILPSGADGSAPHLTWDDRPLQPDTSTFFEIAGCYRRYHAPACRTIFLGTPPAEMRHAEAALVEGLEAGLEAARAGNRACDVAAALFGALSRAGIERGGRCGYPVGLSYPPDWGERTISLRTSDESILEPGMTFHFMPALWTPAWGLLITETILIRDEGPAESLTELPRQLSVKDG
jgi:ectoine hydrolase